MFELELEWDRPAKLLGHQTKHVLRVRIRPQTGGGSGLPVRVAVALDTSGSMAGEKLERAKEACQAVVSQLRREDKLSLAGFATEVSPLLENLAGGEGAAERAKTALSQLRAGGCTRTDLALEWMKEALPAERGVARAGILITDGHATNPKGSVLDENDRKLLIEKVEQFSSEGIMVCAVGLGNAANFNRDFLVKLSDSGKGGFVYADTPEALEPELRKKLASCQAFVTVGGKILLAPCAGVRVEGFCRFRPEYMPLEESAPNELSPGAIRADTPTDLLVEVSIPPGQIGESSGKRDVISVQLEADILAKPVTATAGIYQTNGYSESQKINPEVNRDRLCWDINVCNDNLTGTDDPKRTGELLENMQLAALRAGEMQIAGQAEQQLDELKKTGKLNPDGVTKMLRDSRKLGGDA